MVKRLFWDIETSPCQTYTWRTGWKLTIGHHMLIKEAAIICLSYKWEDDDEVHTLEWDEGSDKDLIRQFLPIAREADELCAHNGDKFDMPWFNTRCLLHGFDGCGTWKTIDTCKLARSKFAFNSNSLQYLAQRLLGEEKVKHDGFDMWRDIMEKNCPKAMADMVKYCEHDVLLLERIYKRMEAYGRPKSNAAVLDGNHRWGCPYCGSTKVRKSKTITTAAGSVQHQMFCRDHDTRRYYTISNLKYKEYQEDRFEAQRASVD